MKELQELLKERRLLCKNPNIIDYVSDQEQKIPQPPLYKEPVSDIIIPLPVNYDELNIHHNFLDIINNRKSSRVYTGEGITLLQLSYLLWCTQGVKEIRGKSYATIRTVPSAGARHPFETYLYINKVEGLKEGLYHYLPQNHSLEFIKEIENSHEFINESVHGQVWAVKADVIFYYGYIPYRGEWRYSIGSHRVALMDIGYVSENLYLACTSINLGSCAIGSCSEHSNEVIGLDGYDEFLILAHTVGTVKEEDQIKEKSHYKFVEEQGL